MERFPTGKNSDHARHPVLGNLYMASSVKDAVESRSFRIKDIAKDEEGVRENRIAARLALSEPVGGYPAFIYIHAAKHSKEEHPSRRRRVPIFDELESCLIEIPEQFSIADLRSNNWESDLIILAQYDPIRRRDIFMLGQYLDEILKNPKISLPSRVIKPRLPSF